MTHPAPLDSSLAARYRDDLLDDTLAFWFPRCVDAVHGGFFGCFDRDGTLVDDDKSVWQQGRHAWLLATLHHDVEPRPEWLEWSLSGIGFLERHAFDRDGRMFFQVARDGRPIRRRRYVFSEAFACIAFAAVARATGDGRLADRARELFALLVRHYDDPSLITPKFTDVRPAKGLAFPMILLHVAQEMRECLDEDAAGPLIDRLIAEIRTDFVKPELEAVLETVGTDGAPLLGHFDGRTLNPGHAIEAAWFVLREARHRDGDAGLVELGTAMLDWMWQRGWDEDFGGILYFTGLHGPVQEYWHDMKFWWPQTEALVATAMAWRLTGDEKHARRHRQLSDWAHRVFPDPEHGEWFGYLHRDGTRSSTLKGNLWKGCYHLPRAQWLCWRLLEGAPAA